MLRPLPLSSASEPRYLFVVCSLLLLVSCSRPGLDDIVAGLRAELSRENADAESLETYLYRIGEMDIRRHRALILDAVERYQDIFFKTPTRKKLACLRKYQAFALGFERDDSCKEQIEEIAKVNRLLEDLQQRNAKAPQVVERLLAQWKNKPEARRRFFSALQVPHEMGGVIFDHDPIELIFIEDRCRSLYSQYLEEFAANRFEHIDELEEAFLQRFTLQKARGDQSTRAHAEAILFSVKLHFAKLRRLFALPAGENNQKEVDKSKRALIVLGLKKTLLQRSYFIDRLAYLQDPQVVLFFHSHPFDSDYPYPNAPSGHDEEMTLRCAPSLVFDVGKNTVVLYSVVLGQSQRIARWSMDN